MAVIESAEPNVRQVLDKGFLALDGALASDLAVVNGARVSFNSESQEMTERDAGLIRFLMRERHGSPFEHGYFRFLVKAPIFVVREHHRHRAGHSYNEWSGRYSKLEAEFYVPEFVRTQVGKPGAYTFEPVDDATREPTRREIEEAAASAFSTYERLLEQDVAKEVARDRCYRSPPTPSTTGAATRAASCTSAAAQPRVGAVRDPAVRGGRRVLPGRADADHPCGVPRQRPHSALAEAAARQVLRPGRRGEARKIRGRGRVR